MVDKTLVNEVKDMVNLGANKAEPGDLLKSFELIKQLSQEVDFLKEDVEESDMTAQIGYTDLEKMYWIKLSNGRVEYGEGKIKKPSFSISGTKEVILGLFLGELDANIIAPIGKLKVGGNPKIIRVFQEIYEDSIEIFKEKYLK